MRIVDEILNIYDFFAQKDAKKWSKIRTIWDDEPLKEMDMKSYFSPGYPIW